MNLEKEIHFTFIIVSHFGKNNCQTWRGFKIMIENKFSSLGNPNRNFHFHDCREGLISSIEFQVGFPIAIPLRIALRNATQFLLPFPQDLLRIFRFLLRLICD